MWAIILTKQIKVPVDFPEKCQRGCFISASRGVLKVHALKVMRVWMGRDSNNVFFSSKSLNEDLICIYGRSMRDGCINQKW